MSTIFQTETQLFPLRGRQAGAIEAVRQAMREGHKRIVLQAPTGAGKTVISSHMIAMALEKGKSVLFTVPRLSLIGQTIRRFEAQGICDIGVIQGRHERTDHTARVQVASVDTLVRRPLPEVDFVIIDEVHMLSDAMNKLLDGEAWSKKIVIGMSATPWKKGMGLRWKKLIVIASTREMIDEGWLTPVVAYGVPEEFEPDRSKVHTVAGDYVESEAEKAMTTQTIVGNVVTTWWEKGPGDRTLMFCVNRSHAKKMQQEFWDAGISCGYIDGDMDVDEREVVLRRYRSGEDKVLSSIDTIGVGFDEDVRCIIYLRLTKSEIKLVQDGGRGLRLAEGKQALTFLDHAGVCEHMGLFTDIHHDTLDMRAPDDKGEPFKKDKVSKPHKCPRCNALCPNSRAECPVCGARLKVDRGPQHVDGELVLIGEGKTPKQAKAKAKEDLPRAAWYGGLLWIARERGYAEGWAANKYREKFGNWPNGMAKVPVPPAAQVVSYEKHLRIKWSKSRQRESVTA